MRAKFYDCFMDSKTLVDSTLKALDFIRRTENNNNARFIKFIKSSCTEMDFVPLVRVGANFSITYVYR